MITEVFYTTETETSRASALAQLGEADPDRDTILAVLRGEANVQADAEVVRGEDEAEGHDGPG